ncbi:hypothetical protein WA026_002914 [Henosepilachna vigintioctopunctata]|uniref:HMG box domain-containing protein n=1 Tax=Henosepilachna vigintioctopunctata TaxID=420089 RepID=A0AAW1TN33_9CUCU
MEVTSSPQLTKISDMDLLIEDLIDGGPPSVGSGDIPPGTPNPGSTASTPLTSKKEISQKWSSYRLYSEEYRKQIVQNNPESNFGEISRIVGFKWRSKINEAIKANLLLDEQCASLLSYPNPDMTYDCFWDKCDFQFEELADCLEHLIKNKECQGHVRSYFLNPDSELHCQWRNCLTKNKKNLQPFLNLARWVRHFRDMHINKSNGRVVPSCERKQNFKPSSKSTFFSRSTPSVSQISSPASYTTYLAVHICTTYSTKRLQVENNFMPPWEEVLHANQENDTTRDPEKLQNISTWLGKKVDQQDNVHNALWALRNQLLRDTLGLTENFNS